MSSVKQGAGSSCPTSHQPAASVGSFLFKWLFLILGTHCCKFSWKWTTNLNLFFFFNKNNIIKHSPCAKCYTGSWDAELRKPRPQLQGTCGGEKLENKWVLLIIINSIIDLYSEDAGCISKELMGDAVWQSVKKADSSSNPSITELCDFGQVT